MNENFNEITLLFIICIPPVLACIISVIRKIYIYYHPPKEIGNLRFYCDFSARKKRLMALYALVLLFSLYQSITIRRLEFIALDIITILLLICGFFRDRIFENGISYNNIYIFINDIKEITYEKKIKEYLIMTKFPTPSRIYVKSP